MREIRELRLTDGDLTNLYMWLDSIPLSRPRKHLDRDFSDARLAAEITFHFKPKLFDIKSIPTVNARDYKLSNWEAVGRKAFRYINIELFQQDIVDLVDGYPGGIENFLYVLKYRLETEPLIIEKKVKNVRKGRSKTPERTKTSDMNRKLIFDENKYSNYSGGTGVEGYTPKVYLGIANGGLDVKKELDLNEQNDIKVKEFSDDGIKKILPVDAKNVKQEAEKEAISLPEKVPEVIKINFENATHIKKLETSVKNLEIDIKERDHIIDVQKKTIELLNREVIQLKNMIIYG